MIAAKKTPELPTLRARHSLRAASGSESPCPSCKWRLGQNDNGATCIMGLAPISGRCAGHQLYSPNSMFGPKSPAERAAPRDSMNSWSNYEIVGGDCQYVNFGQNAPQTKPLGWGHGWGSSPRRCALERQWVEGANASS